MTEQEMLLLASLMGHDVVEDSWRLRIHSVKGNWYLASKRHDAWCAWKFVDEEWEWRKSTIDEVIAVLESPPWQ
jgi:hypothetical protein